MQIDQMAMLALMKLADKDAPSESNNSDFANQTGRNSDPAMQKDAEKLYQSNQAIYDTLLESTTDGWWDEDLTSDDIYFSPSFKKFLGYEDSELKNNANTWTQIFDEKNLNLLINNRNKHIQEKGSEPFSQEVEYICKDGSPKWAIYRCCAIENEDGNFTRIMGTQNNITHFKQSKPKSTNNLLEIDLIYRSTRMAQESNTEEEALRSCINLICEITGWPIGHIYFVDKKNESLISSKIWVTNHSEMPEFLKSKENNILKRGEGLPGRVWDQSETLWIHDLQGEIGANECHAYTDLDVHSSVAFPVIIHSRVMAVCEFFIHHVPEDYNHLSRMFQLLGEQVGHVLERKKNEVQLESLAHYDTLTKLPNRAYFLQTLERAIKKAQKAADFLALLFLDLDKFKRINDTLGHDIGDELLKVAAKQISDAARDTDFVARLGGDEFVILSESITSPQQAATIASKIVESFQKPFTINGHEVITSASIGIAIFPMAGNDISSLMKNADMAMYQAKESGRNNYEFFSMELNKEHRRLMNVEEQLRRVLTKDELIVVFQPKMDILKDEIYGFEALLRWNNSKLGLVSPGEFIPIAEDTGFIKEIGEWVLRTAVHQFDEWMKELAAQSNPLAKSLILSVNLSASQLTPNIEPLLKTILSHVSFKPEQLTLELTETAVMNNVEASTQILQKIAETGVGIAIDDFGTGYSSMSYLKQLPFSTLKIDQSFIRDVVTSPNDAAIVKSIIQLGQTMGLSTIAEGVETKSQLDFLRMNECHYIQGFYFSRPLAINAVMPYIQAHLDKPVMHKMKEEAGVI